MSGKRSNSHAEEGLNPPKVRKAVDDVKGKILSIKVPPSVPPSRDTTTGTLGQTTKEAVGLTSGEKVTNAGSSSGEKVANHGSSSTEKVANPGSLSREKVDNPFAYLFTDGKNVLRGAMAITGAPEGGSYEIFIVPTVDFLEIQRPTHARRLLGCASHPDVPFKHPKGGIVNVALQDPKSLSFNSTTGYLTSRETKTWVVSSLVGEACYYSAEPIKQICLTPSAHGWHRFVAVLAQVYGKQTLFFPTYQGGLSFATTQFASKSGRRRNSSAGPPIEGPALSSDEQIPIFDGREQFKLKEFWDKSYTDPVEKGSTVMVLFTVKKGGLGSKAQNSDDLPRDVKFALYLNILAIIVLQEPGERFRGRAIDDGPQSFGVDNVAEEFVETDDDDEEGDGGNAGQYIM